MSKRKELQMQILQNYFKIDGNVATLELQYDSFAELINQNFGDDKIEKLNDKLFSDIRDAVSLLPRGFKLDLNIVIKDFGDYSLQECEKIIKQNIYLVAYQAIRHSNKKRLNGWSLIGIGALVLLASYLLRNHDLWFDLINISGTLFVWEGVNTAFIERNMESKATRTLARAVHNITISQMEKKHDGQGKNKKDKK